jgi:hypothetical protein
LAGKEPEISSKGTEANSEADLRNAFFQLRFLTVLGFIVTMIFKSFLND